ncbi:MAG: DUF2232 domain-containing protein [Hyphomicrobiales bacterium]
MRQAIPVGIGAGLAAAAFYLLVVSYPVTSMVLLYVAPLPLFIAGLGWGGTTAAIGVFFGAGLVALANDPRVAMSFLANVGVTPVCLSYLALLSRLPARHHAGGAGRNHEEARQWYPEGRLVLWAAAFAAGLVSLGIILSASSAEIFYRSLSDLILRIVAAAPKTANDPTPNMGADFNPAIAVLARLVPLASAALWLVAMLVNLWLAARILTLSGRQSRPFAPFHSLTLPPQTGLALALAVALACLASGMTALIAGIVAAVTVTAFAIQGLAVCHAVTLSRTTRPILLAGLYIALLVFNWIAILALACLGVIETVSGLRRHWCSP